MRVSSNQTLPICCPSCGKAVSEEQFYLLDASRSVLCPTHDGLLDMGEYGVVQFRDCSRCGEALAAQVDPATVWWTPAQAEAVHP